MCAHTAEATTRSEIFFVVCVDVSFMILKIDKDLYNFCAHKSCRHSRHTKSRERSMESQSSGPGLQPDFINSMCGSITKWNRLEQGALVATITRSDVFGFVERSEAESNSVAMMCNRASFVNSVNINDASVHGVCVTNTTLQQQRTLWARELRCDFTSHQSKCLQRSHDRTRHGIQSLETIHWINRGDVCRRPHRLINTNYNNTNCCP